MNKKHTLSIIAAMSENRVIGNENKLVWNIPEELKRFRELTSGHPIIMGRKTHESIGRVLPNRTNIIITRDKDYKVEGAIIVHSLEEAIELARAQPGSDEIFVIGGGQIYQQAIPLADRIYLTVVEGNYQGDTFFPDYSGFKNIISRKRVNSPEVNYLLIILER